MFSLPRAFQICLLLLTLCSLLVFNATGGPLYSTGFETFVVGSHTIVGTDGWSGTTSTTGCSGIDSETEHGTPGLGKAGWLGGNPTSAFATSFNVRRHIPPTTTYYDPLANNAEVVTITALVGIKDSDTLIANRDRFELFIASGTAATPIAAIQFDNVTRDGSGNVQQLIRRSSSTAGFPGFNTYTTTNNYFLYETIHKLYVRINFRTNRWTASWTMPFCFWMRYSTSGPRFAI